jgi:hypothetical protein
MASNWPPRSCPGSPIVTDRLAPASREGGLYDEIEHAKDAALAAHLQRLAGAVGDGTVARLTQLVQTTVAPAITRGVLRRPPPGCRPSQCPARRVRSPAAPATRRNAGETTMLCRRGS